MKGFLREVIITLVLALAIFLIYQAVAQTAVVDGSSMVPSLENGERLIIVKAFYQPKRGDIVIIHPPKLLSSNKEFVKRLIGLPGDTIEVKNRIVYMNGNPLNEPYIKEAPDYTFGPFTVPPGNYFVLGDNRNNSTDSHVMGGWTITRKDIVGKVWLRYWPFSHWGLIHGYRIDSELRSPISYQGNKMVLETCLNR